ncbi:hypothetical protein H696_00920 [Fonticula alba]|uniref:ERCC4 domain-containing protein n=1 Tax=Fonticula alba TaxID=691883 RepID=A0A058ZHE3_FONAL|nr:hypothetical protein H696_00920 [Fonticula alba]KCV73381.1 hypothetical protein H696_00920 [Fonticula alba]|eukprot:XP_009493082.1 hypothetical protein H696_00920 [Fonticula alba]
MAEALYDAIHGALCEQIGQTAEQPDVGSDDWLVALASGFPVAPLLCRLLLSPPPSKAGRHGPDLILVCSAGAGPGSGAGGTPDAGDALSSATASLALLGAGAPRIVSEAVKPSARQDLYAAHPEDGVPAVAATARVLISDMLSNRVDFSRVRRALILLPARLTDRGGNPGAGGSANSPDDGPAGPRGFGDSDGLAPTDALAVTLLKGRVPLLFLAAHPLALPRLAISLVGPNISLWPRFRQEVQHLLDGESDHPDGSTPAAPVSECLVSPLRGAATAQAHLLELLASSIREVQSRAGRSFSASQLAIGTVFERTFERTLRRVEREMGLPMGRMREFAARDQTGKDGLVQLIDGLRLLRRLLFQLHSEDAVTVYSHMQDMIATGPSWTLSPAFEPLFQALRARVYLPASGALDTPDQATGPYQPASPAGTPEHSEVAALLAAGLRPAFEVDPRWAALRALLAAAQSQPCLVLVRSRRTAMQLYRLLQRDRMADASRGSVHPADLRELEQAWLRYCQRRRLHGQSVVSDVARASSPGATPSPGPTKRPRFETPAQRFRSRAAAASASKSPESPASGPSTSVETPATPGPSGGGTPMTPGDDASSGPVVWLDDEDSPGTGGDDGGILHIDYTYFALVDASRPTVSFVAMLDTTPEAFYEYLLSTTAGGGPHVILYDVELAFLRVVELVAAGARGPQQPAALSGVSLINVQNSALEQQYLSALKVEHAAFSRLIARRTTAPSPAARPLLPLYGDSSAPAARVGLLRSGPTIDPAVALLQPERLAFAGEMPASRYTGLPAGGHGGSREVGPGPRTVIIDVRELRATLPRALLEAGMALRPMQLREADYILGPGFGIERKAPADLRQSIQGGRLAAQLTRMVRAFPEGTFLLLEVGPRGGAGRVTTWVLDRLVEILVHLSRPLVLASGRRTHPVRLVWSRSDRHAAELFAYLKSRVREPDPNRDVPDLERLDGQVSRAADQTGEEEELDREGLQQRQQQEEAEEQQATGNAQRPPGVPGAGAADRQGSQQPPVAPGRWIPNQAAQTRYRLLFPGQPIPPAPSLPGDMVTTIRNIVLE